MILFCGRQDDRLFLGVAMSNIWRYVLKVDDGIAPCADNGRLTLTCCKPIIRLGARNTDWVLGYLPRPLCRMIDREHFRPRVVWAGQVALRSTLGEYSSANPDRPDALYRAGSMEVGEAELVWRPGHVHATANEWATDWRGRFALEFEPFWYWGGDGVVASPEVAELAHYYIGQSKRGSSPERVAAVTAWLYSLSPPGRHGNPRSPEPIA